MTTERSMSLRVRDELLEHFRAVGLAPGDQLPSEAEIAQRWDVGRSTVREALKYLEQDGIVIVVHGRGRFLSPLAALNVERPVTRFESTSEMLDALGHTWSTVVLSVAECEPTDEQRKTLHLSDGQTVIRLEKMRSTNDTVLIYSLEYLPRHLVPGPIKHMNWRGSLRTLLAAQGYEPVSSVAHLQATCLPAEAREQYALDASGCWLRIRETAFAVTGDPVIQADNYHRGESFVFNVLRK